MKLTPGLNAILTGASGGLGTYIAQALSRRQINLALVAFPGVELEPLRERIVGSGVRAIAIAADLRISDERKRMLAEAGRFLGPIHILINNAGIEFTSSYHELSDESIQDIMRINLEAPMLLTKHVLPQMLAQALGHIVNVSSLAGKAGPAFQAPYAATKAGLIAFTSSIRATYYKSGVSASLICPGFVEAGIYARLKARTGCVAPLALGTSRPETVAKAVVRAIEKDLPEIIINPIPVRPLFATMALFPSLGEWMVRQTGAHEFFRRVAEAEKNPKEPL